MDQLIALLRALLLVGGIFAIVFAARCILIGAHQTIGNEPTLTSTSRLWGVFKILLGGALAVAAFGLVATALAWPLVI